MEHIESQLPKSLREPQIEPSGHCYMILQDFGPNGGGWGPAAVAVVGGIVGPAIYTGNDLAAIDHLGQLASDLSDVTGRPTKFVKYGSMEEIAGFGNE